MTKLTCHPLSLHSYAFITCVTAAACASPPPTPPASVVRADPARKVVVAARSDDDAFDAFEWRTLHLGGTAELAVRERPTPPTVDGDLSDWDPSSAVEVARREQPGLSPPVATDLTVRVAFAYDESKLYVAVWTIDDQLQFPQRAWRYGDGLMLTFGDATSPTTARFSTYGFASTEKGGSQPVLVNRDGEFFPGDDVSDITTAIRVQPDRHGIQYEIAIPFRHTGSCRPFSFGACGINLTYADADGARRQRVQLVRDVDADTEATVFRRVRSARFLPSPTGRNRCLDAVSRRFALEGDPVDLRVGCVLPDAEGSVFEWRTELVTPAGTIVASVKQASRVVSGPLAAVQSIDVPSVPSGRYGLRTSVTVGGRETLASAHEVYVVGADVHELFDRASALRARRSPLMPSLDIRVQWIQQFVREVAPTADPARLEQYVGDARRLVQILEQPSPTWSERGSVFRFAHRSAIDGRLEPYSVYVPPDYDPSKPPALLVTLHGSGVDERQTIATATKRYGKASWLVLAPQARGLSDWYLGPSGEDVIESMRALATILPFDAQHVFLHGFSMGGYGAWRLALSHPQTWKAVAIESGAVDPPLTTTSDESVTALLKRASKPRAAFLVVHGDLDQAVPIGPVRQLMGALRAAKIEHELVELPGAAHGDYDVGDRVLAWFRAHAH